MKGEEKVLEFADELTDEQLFAVNGGGWFSSSSSSSSSSRSSSHSYGSGSHGGSGSHRSSGSSSSGGSAKTSSNSSKKSSSSIGSKISSAASSIGSKISSAVSSVASKVGNSASGSKQNASSTSEQKKTTGSSVYMPYQGMYTPPTRPQNSSSKSENKVSGSQGQKAPSATPSGQAANTATRATNSTADNAPTGMSGCPSTYLSGNFSAGSSNAGTAKQNSSRKSSSSNWKQTSSSSSSSSNRSNSSRSSFSGSSSDSSDKSNNYNPLAFIVKKNSPSSKDSVYDIDSNIESITNKIFGNTEDGEESVMNIPDESKENDSNLETTGTVLFSKKDIKIDKIYNMQCHKGTPIDDEMYGTTEKHHKEAEEMFKVTQILCGLNNINLEEKAFNDIKIVEEVPNKFSTVGCKITATAYAIEAAIGHHIDIAEINKFDANQDGLFSSEETLEAFKAYLSDEKSVEYDWWHDKLNKKTLDAIASYGDEIYILGRARSVVKKDDTHWVLLYGYHMNDQKQVQFEFIGTSNNDKNRNYILGAPLESQRGNYFTIDFLQTYTIKGKK